MARTDPQTNLRLPPELKQQLQQKADENKRSFNGEIVHRLESSLKQEASDAKTPA